MFAITRKIVYKWYGMGDGVRNGAEDEVLSVGGGWDARGGKNGMGEREREKEREKRTGAEGTEPGG